MKVSKTEIDKINNIQFEIFKSFIEVCSKLNLKYYMVHGSLLGTVRYNNFFPFDDDIDVAMPRKDFEIFIEKGQKLLSDNLFIQCNKTEKDYPLVFAKLRNSDTAFIQPILDGLDVNKGIYIDIFPIDYYPENNFSTFKTNIMEKFYRIRVLAQMNKKRNIIKNIICKISKLILPNYNLAVEKLNDVYAKGNKSNKCIVYGGKKIEKGIDLSLFGDGRIANFRDIEVTIPDKFEKYLNIIYGNYSTYSPSKQYMVNDDLIEISANIVDTKKSYKYYDNHVKKGKKYEK